MIKYVTLTEVFVDIQRWTNVNKSLLRDINFIVGISRGGLFPAAYIATKFDIPLVAVYIDKKDKVYLDRAEWLVGKKVLLVDDILRTGKTMKKMEKLLNTNGVEDIRTFTIYATDTNNSIILPWDHQKQLKSNQT